MQKPNSANTFIVIEGIDGVGKTTIAKNLAQALGAVYYPTPPETLVHFKRELHDGTITNLRHFVDQLGNNEIRFFYYLIGVLYASQDIKELLKSNSVVCDRYISSTLAYHYALSPTLKNIDLSNLHYLQPDAEFLLDANETTRMQRINSRGSKSASDKQIEENTLLLGNIRSEFRNLGLKVVDTSALSISQVVKNLTTLLLTEINHE